MIDVTLKLTRRGSRGSESCTSNALLTLSPVELASTTVKVMTSPASPAVGLATLLTEMLGSAIRTCTLPEVTNGTTPLRMSNRLSRFSPASLLPAALLSTRALNSTTRYSASSSLSLFTTVPKAKSAVVAGTSETTRLDGTAASGRIVARNIGNGYSGRGNAASIADESRLGRAIIQESEPDRVRYRSEFRSLTVPSGNSATRR